MRREDVKHIVVYTILPLRMNLREQLPGLRAKLHDATPMTSYHAEE